MNAKELNDKLKEVMQPLYEMATVVSDDNLYISVNPDAKRGWENQEYFKVYNSSSYRTADKVARIKFREPAYVEHNNEDGKESWKLNVKDVKNLMKLLQAPSKKENGLNNWQYAILQFNLEAFEDSNREFCSQLTMQKQKQMKEFQPEKKWLPIDLPLTNYSDLK